VEVGQEWRGSNNGMCGASARVWGDGKGAATAGEAQCLHGTVERGRGLLGGGLGRGWESGDNVPTGHSRE
jgi:hypothetical protein